MQKELEEQNHIQNCVLGGHFGHHLDMVLGRGKTEKFLLVMPWL